MKIKISDKDNSFLTREVVDLDTGRTIDLPHGSGIDDEWHVEDKGSYYRLDNAFHFMNDTGYYVGWQPFFLTVPKKKPRDFKLHFINENRYWTQKIMLRDYLEELFDSTFYDLEEGLKYSDVRITEMKK